MDDNDKIRLQVNHKLIVNNLNVEDVLDHLISEDIFTADFWDEIHKKSKKKQNRELLANLPSRGSRAFAEFILALKEHEVVYGHIVKSLNETNIEEARLKFELNSCESPNFQEDEELQDGGDGVDGVAEFNSKNVFSVISKDPQALKNWKSLGRTLGLGEDDIVVIHHNNQGDIREATYEMLTTWRQKTGKAATIDRLLAGLWDSDLNRLRVEINRIVKEEQPLFFNGHIAKSLNEPEIEEARLKLELVSCGSQNCQEVMKVEELQDEVAESNNINIFSVISKDPQAMKNWKSLGRALGLVEGDIVAIDHKNQGDIREATHEMLTTWHQKMGTAATATIDRLLAGLRDSELNGLRDQIIRIINEPQSLG